MEIMQTRLQRSVFHAIRKNIVAKGYYPDITTYGNTPEEYARLQGDVRAIEQSKGFAIEIFNQSSARAKYQKLAPRIVIITDNVYDGDVGAPPGLIFERSPVDANKYISGMLPSQSSHLVLSIHLLSKKSQEESLLNQILSEVLGQRTFLPYYDDATSRFFIHRTSYNDLDDPIENVMEKAYSYTIKDIYLSETTPVATGISPIKEIEVTNDLEEPTIKVNSTL